jgi:pilus assembly protein Flp/PilA
MLKQTQRFWKDKSGATAIEYALIASGISVAILIAVTNVGTRLVAVFTTLQTAF